MDSAHLQTDAIRKISLDAVQSVAGRPPADVDVRLGLDSSDDLAWFIVFQLEPDPDRAVSTEMRVRIGHQIRDALIASGDERYPFLRFLTRDEWGSLSRARSA